MLADDIVEDLSNGKQDSSRNQIDERSPLAENSKNQDGFQNEECDQEDQRNKLVEDVERNASVSRTVQAGIPETGPRESSIEADVSSADEQDGSR